MEIKINFETANADELLLVKQLCEKNLILKGHIEDEDEYENPEIALVETVMECLAKKDGKIINIDKINELVSKVVKTDIDALISQMKEQGIIYEPKTGFISKI